MPTEQELNNAPVQTEPAEGTVNAPDAPSVQEQTASPDSPSAPDISPEQEAVARRDREILAALDEVLVQQNIRAAAAPKESGRRKESLAVGVVRRGVGIVSLALILVFMGVVLVTCLFSAAPDYLLPLKLSPVAAVLIGLELLISYMTSGRNFRVNIPALCISAVIVVGCCFMAVALNDSYKEEKTDYNNRSVAAEIYDMSYRELRYVADIERLSVEVDLNPDGTGAQKGAEALSGDDIVKITAELGGSYSAPIDFARECKSIIDGYRIMGIPVTSFRFISEGRLSDFRLDVEGRFLQDYSDSQLAELVNHVYIENYDYIDDLEDFVGETFETLTDENV